MRKIVLVLAFIITSLALPVIAADVDFISIPGHHQKHSTILHFNYNYIYSHVPSVHKYMRYHTGYSIRAAEYQKWFVANVGYFMYEYNAWYVYAKDSNTERTDQETAMWIREADEDVDITAGLIHGLEHNDGQAKYLTLQSGPNIYVLNSIFLNDWIFHLR